MLHICESKCFSRLRPAGYAVPSLKRLHFYEALCVLHASGVSSTQKYEAQLTLHEAALRAMKIL